MNSRAAVERAVGLYLEAINRNDAAIAPLAADIRFSAPMLPGPMAGEATVRQHITDIAPFIVRMDRKLAIIEGEHAALVVAFEGVNGVAIEGAYVFRVADGEIRSLQIFFDTTPLIKGAA